MISKTGDPGSLFPQALRPRLGGVLMERQSMHASCGLAAGYNGVTESLVLVLRGPSGLTPPPPTTTPINLVPTSYAVVRG